MKRQIHSPSQIRDYLTKQHASGLSVKRYCAQEKLAVSTFWNWRKRYPPIAEKPSAAPASFARLGVASFMPQQGYEVVFDNRITIRVPARFDGESLRLLISSLR